VGTEAEEPTPIPALARLHGRRSSCFPVSWSRIPIGMDGALFTSPPRRRSRKRRRSPGGGRGRLQVAMALAKRRQAGRRFRAGPAGRRRAAARDGRTGILPGASLKATMAVARLRRMDQYAVITCNSERARLGWTSRRPRFLGRTPWLESAAATPLPRLKRQRTKGADRDRGRGRPDTRLTV